MQQSLPLPKYHSVYLVLKERLRDGLYDVRVPGEMELMEEFGVSRERVRQIEVRAFEKVQKAVKSHITAMENPKAAPAVAAAAH